MHLYKKTFLYNSEYSLWEVLVRCHLIFKKITLQQQQIKILIYFCMYGVNADTMDRLLDDEVVPNRQSIYNTRTILKELGILTRGKKGRWLLTSALEELDLKDTLNIIVQCKKQ